MNTVSKRNSGWALLVALLVLAGGVFAADRPNVLFIISDDLNNDVSAYGHAQVKTPSLDRLAATGLTFERAYCQYPLCNPSRSSMLSGLYPVQTGITGNGVPIRKEFPKVVTLPQLFRNAGYHTGRVGKIYHYGVPGQIGTNGLDDAPSWDEVYNPIGKDKTEESDIFTLTPGNYGSVVSWLAQESTDDEQTDGQGALATIRMLEERAESDQPFFLAFGLYRPHTPYVAPKKYFDMYPRDEIVLPAKPEVREPYAAYERARPEEDAMTDNQRRDAIQAYYASTTFMDAQVGRVLDALERLGLAENTIVVFTSDHGYSLGEHGLWKKRSLFERSARVPLIIRTPEGLSAGLRSEQLVELVDLYPTLAALAGLEVPAPVSGMDLSPTLANPGAFTRRAALTQDHRRYQREGTPHDFMSFGIRTDQYRYIEWGPGGQYGVELYDHRTDPEEMVNLAHDKDQAGTVQQLQSLMNARLHELRHVNLDEWR